MNKLIDYIMLIGIIALVGFSIWLCMYMGKAVHEGIESFNKPQCMSNQCPIRRE